jgi:L-lactate dehydrogenase complex protein LldG
MTEKNETTVLESIRSALKRKPGDAVAPRPPVVPPRIPGNLEEEIALFSSEVEKLSGSARKLTSAGIADSLGELVRTENVKTAVIWPDPALAGWGLESKLRGLGVEVVPASAGKQALARCDLGVTGADFILPETGTVGLLSSSEKPRAVSLLPRVHLAVAAPSAFRADLHQVFAEAKNRGYLVFITGPSRTADIELTVTLGVHGPKTLVVWVVV